MTYRTEKKERESVFPLGFPAGSFVIERYVYRRPTTGKPGVQWVVHRVRKDGELDQLSAHDTRREAAERIANA